MSQRLKKKNDGTIRRVLYGYRNWTDYSLYRLNFYVYVCTYVCLYRNSLVAIAYIENAKFSIVAHSKYVRERVAFLSDLSTAPPAPVYGAIAIWLVAIKFSSFPLGMQFYKNLKRAAYFIVNKPEKARDSVRRAAIIRFPRKRRRKLRNTSQILMEFPLCPIKQLALSFLSSFIR